MIHFIGQKNTPAYDIAERLFGPPDYVHPRMDAAAEAKVGEDDTVIHIERIKQWMMAR